jgi:aminoglycoside phosphotransferase family enzyme
LYAPQEAVQQNKFYLYDRLEFNDSLRYADVAEDVAHISMDLDYQKRSRFGLIFSLQDHYLLMKPTKKE